MNEILSKEEWFTLNDDQWRDVLTTAWCNHHVPIGAAIWWIALGGIPGDCDDDALDAATRDVVGRLQAGSLMLFGSRAGALPAPIPREQIPNTKSFIADLPIDGSAIVCFDHMVEGGEHADRIEDRCNVHWSRLTIERGQLVALWPAHTSDDAAWIAELESRINANPALTQGDAIVAMKIFCSERGINITEKPIKAAWKRAKGIDGKAKTGPTGPRTRRDNCSISTK